MIHVVDVTESMRVSVFEPVNEGRIVDMGVEVDDVERLTVRSDNRECNCVVASKHHRHRACVQYHPGQVSDVLESAFNICDQDVRVTHIYNSIVCKLIFKKHFVGIMVEITISTKSQGMLPYRA